MLQLDSVKYKGLLDPTLEREPMSKEDTRTFVMVTMGEKSANGEFGEPERQLMENIGTTFQGKVFLKRLSANRLDVGKVASPGVICFVLSMESTSNPAMVVVWAYSLALIAAMKGKPVDMALLADLFPMGFVRSVELEKVWDGQKGWMLFDKDDPRHRIDNYLDTQEAWEFLKEFVGLEVHECNCGHSH